MHMFSTFSHPVERVVPHHPRLSGKTQNAREENKYVPLSHFQHHVEALPLLPTSPTGPQEQPRRVIGALY